MDRYQARLEQKGALLGRIVDIGAELYAISCACRLRADHRQADAGQAATRRSSWPTLFCGQARRRADVLFDELFHNDDDAQYKAAQKVLDGPLQFFEDDIVDPAGEGPTIREHEAPAAEKLAKA